jgi:hypothetical protein
MRRHVVSRLFLIVKHKVELVGVVTLGDRTSRFPNLCNLVLKAPVKQLDAHEVCQRPDLDHFKRLPEGKRQATDG